MFEKLEDLAKNNKKISDFHIRAGSPLAYRQTGEIIMVQEVMVTAQDLKDLLSMNCNEGELEKFETTHELDTAITLSGLRFRANFYKTINGPACVCRRVESKIPDMEQFSLPQVLYDIIDMHKGLVLVTGPTGSGKSTTLAAIVNEINKTRTANIITVEDPVEFIHTDSKSIVSHREVGKQTQSFAAALKAALREDPDVILVGEMRDLETVSSIEHDDVVLYASNGMIINGSDEHTKLAEQFLSAYPNAKWEILWSISSDIAFNTKPSENWVTTCVTVTYGEGDEATTLQRIIDAQIVEGKIKLVYGYERTVSKEEAEQNKIEIYDSSITEIIDVNAEIEELADSIMIPEGPVWDDSSKSLLFVDVMNNKLFKWNEENGASEYISPSGNTGYAPNLGQGLLGANGLAIDSEGNIIVCQHGDRRLAKISNSSSNDPAFETVVDNFEGDAFNSPNDLAISNDGSIYFSDPAFGFFDLNSYQFVDSELKGLDFNGIYKYSPETEKAELITKDIDLPNGLALSTDEKTLYVNKMGMLDSNPQIIKINLETNESETFFEGKELAAKFEGNFDGMKVHSSGNIFTTGPGGILVISPEGKLKARLNFGHSTNCAFDTNEEYLYVTGFINNQKVYRLKLK